MKEGQPVSTLHGDGTARMGAPVSKRPVTRWLIVLLFVGGGILGGVLFFHTLAMPWFVRHGSETEVPDLRGLSTDEAGPLLAKARLETGTIAEAYHDRVPSGKIVRHVPPPGFKVKQGRAVDLVVSQGPEALRVPALEGESSVHARFLLIQAGLQPGRVRTIRSADVPADHVVASSPQPGTRVGGSSSIDLLVSLGPPPRMLVMPDVRGEDPDAVEASLKEAGFRVEQRFWPGARSEWPRVTDQNPPPGYPVEEGGLIELIMGR
jgi:beta-lactam-binding protein with PASTA domain